MTEYISIIISIATLGKDVCDILRTENHVAEIDKAFRKALKKWCPNHIIREKIASRFKNFSNLVHHIQTNGCLDNIDREYASFLETWESELRNNHLTYGRLNEILTRQSVEIGKELLSGQKLTDGKIDNIEKKLDSLGDNRLSQNPTIIYIYSDLDDYKKLVARLEELRYKKGEFNEKLKLYPNDEFFIKEQNYINSEINEIENRVKNLKDTVSSLYKTFNEIDMPERIAYAKKFFVQGKLHDADAVLKETEIDNEIYALRQKRGEEVGIISQIDKKLEEKADEYLIKAQIRQTFYGDSNWFSNACYYYEKSLDAARTPKTMWAYASFLQNHNQFEKAQALHTEALTTLRDLADKNPAHLPNVALVLNNLAILYRCTNQFEKAQALHEEELKIYRDLAKTHPQKYLPNVAMSLNNMAILYANINEPVKSSKAFYEALELYQILAKEDSQTYLPDVAMVLNHLAIIHTRTNDFDKSQEESERALKIYRDFADASPEQYLPDVAATLNTTANLHQKTNEFEKAQKEYEEALTIRRALAENNPQAFLSDLAIVLHDSASLYHGRNMFEKAQKEYQEALAIRRNLSLDNPQAYLPDVSQTLNNLANLHRETGNLDGAQIEYQEALTIRRYFAKDKPQTYLPDVAAVLNNLANLHRITKDFDEAICEYNEALKIRRAFARENPQVYLPDVATTLINLTCMYHKEVPNKEQAITHAKETVEICQHFQHLPHYRKYFEYAISVLHENGINLIQVKSPVNDLPTKC